MNSPRNHNPAPSHELLSAYFDRETSPEEAAEIERLLERSPEARQMLDDFAELSDLLHELPRHTLDASFANRVLQQARPQPIAASVVPFAATYRSTRWKWGTGLGLATTAAAACVIVMVMLPRGQNENQQVAQRNMPVPAAADSRELSESAEREVLPRDLTSPPATGRTISDRNNETLVSKSLSAVSGAAGGASASPADATTLTRSQLAARSPSGIQLPTDVDLNQMAIGTVVEALQSRGDEVSMVKLTVVDVVKGVDRIKVLLTKNSIVADDLKGSLVNKLDATDKLPPGQLPAIYVEAPRRHFEAVMAQLREEWNAPEPIVVGMRLEPAVDPLAMNEIVPEIAPETKLGQQQRRLAFNKELTENRRVQPADKEGLPAPKELVKAEEAKKSEYNPSVASRLEGTAPTRAARGSAGKPVAAKDPPTSEAKQFVLNVPQAVIDRSLQRSVSNQVESRATGFPRPDATDETKSTTETASAPAAAPGEEMLQVLFVFEPGSNAAIEKARGDRKFNAPQRPKKS
jgi:negative regulator of sigma E activity